MARELVQKTIDGRAYEFEQFAATQGLQVLARITKLAGKPLALGIAALKPGAPGDADQSADLLSQAISALTERLDEDEVVGLVKALVTSGVLCDNVQLTTKNFDEHFRGELAHLMAVVAAALEVQYGNFIAAVIAKMPAPVHAKAKAANVVSVMTRT